MTTTPAFIQQDLYFGLNIPGSGQLSDAEFQTFLDTVIAPRFIGLTQFDVKGQVKDANGNINKEQSRLVTLITEDTPANKAAINEVRLTYGQEFNGKGSLQVTNADDLTVNFGPAADLFNNSATPKLIEVDAYFGRNIPGDGEVSQLQFQQFIDNVLAPSVPGLTIFNAKGQTASPDGSLTKENSKVVKLIFEDTLANETALNNALKTYQQLFNSAGELIVANEDVKVSFGPAADLFDNSATPKFIQADLYFGQNIPGIGSISRDVFQEFVDQAIAPLFSGLTQFDARGEVKNAAGTILKEDSQVIRLILQDTLANENAINNVLKAFETQFGAGTLAVFDEDISASFGSPTPATPIVSVSATPGAVEEGKQLQWNFTLNQPAPVGGLVVEFALTQDTDPLPGDITYNVVGSSNITGFELLRDSAGVITGAKVAIAAGATSATLLNNVIADSLTEGPESITYTLINGAGYAVDGSSKEAKFTILDTSTNPAPTVGAIANPSFENPPVADGGFTITPPPGWSLYDPNGLVPVVTTNDSSAVGVFNPDKTSYYNEATDGQNVADLFVVAQPGSGPVGLSQTLSEVLTADTRYSFLVDVGNPADIAGFPGYEVELLAGNTVVAKDNNSLQIAEGTFSTAKVDFTVGKDNPLLGQNLTLRLVNLNQAPGTYLNFDTSALYIEKVKDGSYVYINNPGFETPILGDDVTTTSSNLVNPVAGWNIYDPTGVIARADTTSTTDIFASVGTWNPPTDAYPNGASQGNNVAYSYIPTYAGGANQVGEGFAGISQTLNTVVAANTSYTLTVDIGNTKSYFSQAFNFDYNFNGFPGYRVELLADGEVIGVDNNSLAIAEGKFGTATVSFTAAAGDSILGENLGIRLVNLNTSVGSEVDFDNVQLKAASATVSPITGDQTLFGSSGTTTLSGGQGNDSIYSNGFATSIFGRDGNDTIYGSNKAEFIVGGAGNDTIYGNGGKDTIYGDDGDDLIYGGPDADTIFAGAGNDTIYSNGGNDFINTGVGLDTVWLGGGAATVALDTGVGFDTVNGFQLGATKFQVSSLDGLQFADSANGTQIFQKHDLLAVVSGLSASVFSNNANQIFVA
jgi:Ca2+-binding RTX toxin-like protein